MAGRLIPCVSVIALTLTKADPVMLKIIDPADAQLSE